MLGPMVEGVRARNRAALEQEIRDVATRHLAEYGPGGLSLRAVARELGLASSAVYRYVASRDDLLTQLIVAGYDSLGDAVDDALTAASEKDPRGRFRVIWRALRRWALDHPQQFGLLYGTPVPGYHAPGELTTPAGTRVQARLVEVLAELDASPPEPDGARATLAPLLADPLFADAPPGLVFAGLASWHLALGAVTTELFGQFGPGGVADPAAYFEGILDAALRLFDGPDGHA